MDLFLGLASAAANIYLSQSGFWTDWISPTFKHITPIPTSSGTRSNNNPRLTSTYGVHGGIISAINQYILDTSPCPDQLDTYQLFPALSSVPVEEEEDVDPVNGDANADNEPDFSAGIANQQLLWLVMYSSSTFIYPPLATTPIM